MVETPRNQSGWETNPFKEKTKKKSLGFCLKLCIIAASLFQVFFSCFVWPHATSRILSAGGKKNRGVRIARKSAKGLGEEGRVKPQDYIQEKPSRITKRNER